MVSVGNTYNSINDYNKDNYYLKNEDGSPMEPQKIGEGWKHLDPEGKLQLDEETYKALKEGKDPNTGTQLVQNGVNGEHRAGNDIVFSPHKSFSIYAMTSPENEKLINDIHDHAVKDTLSYLEKNLIQVRQTQDGVTSPVKTGNMVAMRADHTVSREGDKQQHSHVIIFNMSYNENTDKYQALHNDPFHSDAMQQIYENQMAYYGKQAGLPIGHELSNSGKSEYAVISGISKELIDAHSGRANAVKGYLETHKAELQAKYPNASEGELKRVATIETRPEKIARTVEQVREQFNSNNEKAGVTSKEIVDNVEQARKEHTEKAQQIIKPNEYEITRLAANALTENESVFSERDLIKTAAALSRGDVSIEKIQSAVKEMDGEIIKLSNNDIIHDRGKSYTDTVYTTKDILKAEKSIVEKVQAGNGKSDAIMQKAELQNKLNTWQEKHSKDLTNDQKLAAEHILTSQDKYTGIQGDAGTGKTTMLAAVREIAEKEGYQIRGFAPTGKAADELQKNAGIKSQTVDSFLNEKNAGAGVGKQVWMVDESSMLGSQKMYEFVQRAEAANAKTVLIGDTKQLQSISAGKMFGKLQEDSVLKTTRMEEIIRQTDPNYRDVAQTMSAKKIDKAFEKLENQNRVTEIADRQERLDAVKKDYTGSSKNTIIVTARNADRNELNNSIHNELKDHDKIGQQEYSFTVRESKNLSPIDKHFAQNYKIGDRIFANKAGIIGRAGREGKVTSVDPQNHRITVERNDGTERTIDLRTDGQNVSAYSEKEQSFSQGEKIVFLKNDHSLGVQNGQVGEVQKINEDGKLVVKMENGDEKTINLNTQYNYIDRGYAVTDYKSQGQTEERVVYHADTAKDVTFNQSYMAMTRGKEDLKIYTNDKEQLKEQMKNEQTKTNTLEEKYKTAEMKPQEQEHSKLQPTEKGSDHAHAGHSGSEGSDHTHAGHSGDDGKSMEK